MYSRCQDLQTLSRPKGRESPSRAPRRQPRRQSDVPRPATAPRTTETVVFRRGPQLSDPPVMDSSCQRDAVPCCPNLDPMQRSCHDLASCGWISTKRLGMLQLWTPSFPTSGLLCQAENLRLRLGTQRQRLLAEWLQRPATTSQQAVGLNSWPGASAALVAPWLKNPQSDASGLVAMVN